MFRDSKLILPKKLDSEDLTLTCSNVQVGQGTVRFAKLIWVMGFHYEFSEVVKKVKFFSFQLHHEGVFAVVQIPRGPRLHFPLQHPTCKGKCPFHDLKMFADSLLTRHDE